LVCAIGVETVLVHAGAAVHAGSPPPVAVAVFTLGLAAVPSMATGTVTTMLPMAAPAAMVQPAKLLPVVGQPVIVPPVIVGAPVNVIPVGKRSVRLIGAVVAAIVTAILIL
jgi:hypothetical protein